MTLLFLYVCTHVRDLGRRAHVPRDIFGGRGHVCGWFLGWNSGYQVYIGDSDSYTVSHLIGQAYAVPVASSLGSMSSGWESIPSPVSWNRAGPHLQPHPHTLPLGIRVYTTSLIALHSPTRFRPLTLAKDIVPAIFIFLPSAHPFLVACVLYVTFCLPL